MRIAMVGPFGFHPNKTMRSRALSLARPLVQRGHIVQLLMPPWQTPDEADRRWEEDGVAIRYTSLHGGVPGITRRLIQEVLAWEPDVVHCFKPKAYSGLVAWWMWQFHRHRLRLFTDSDDWEGRGGWNERAPYTGWQKRFFARQEQWGLTHCHRLTVASRALQTLAWSHGVSPERIVYLPNGPGISADVGGAAGRQATLGLAERPVLLLYSRLFEMDTARLVTILGMVKKAVPDLALLTVGAGLYEAEVDRWTEQLAAAGLADIVVDVGWVDEEALPPLLAAADVGLYLMEDNLLNRTKCPVKLADMITVGLPVVAEAVGQVPEYIHHGQTGLLRSSGDTAGVAADLIQLLQNPAERHRLGAAARQHAADQFNWNRLAGQLEAAYCESGWMVG